MNSISKISKNSKKKLKKFFSIFLCLTLILYSVAVPLIQFSYSYASETCDPEDEDYEQCIAEEGRERLEEEEERRRDEKEEQLEQEREEIEALIEEHEDDPNWIPPWLITPTSTQTQVFSPTPSNTPNSQTGEGSENTTNTNSATSIDVENINTTTLEEEINVTANTGNNIIADGEGSGNSIRNSSELGEEIERTSGNESQEEDASSQGTEAQGESFSESESSENLSHEATTGEEDDDFSTDASGEELSEGDHAEQLAISEDIDETTVQNENDLELENEMEVISSSGENQLSENEDDVNLETGPGNSQATLENQGNINSTEVGANEEAEAVNEETGNDSANFISDEVSETLTVENDNQAAVENNLSVSSTSGENQLSDNEGDATLITEEVEIIVNLLNILNLNITGQDFTHLIINIFGNLTGEFDLDDIAEDYLGIDEDEFLAIAKNTATGDNSENTAIAQNSETLEVTNQNQAAVINNVDAEGVTGGNELSENEGNVTLMTGRIRILTSILNFINANFSGTDWYFAMINIFGSLTGDILLPDPEQFLLAQDGGVEAINSETGDDSQNQALASETEEISATNDNAAEVHNTVNVTGDSGTNQSIANEDETEMETGEVNVATQIMNWLNYNIFGDRWVMIVVNVFGRWLGRVIAFPGKGDIEAPESGTLVAVAGGEGDLGPVVVAENSQTGENSENFASASNETDWEVNNENQAYVENNVDVQGVSGQNQANGNEDKVNILTGWIDIGVNLFNIVNFNVTGRKWMLLIVNIFGDFFGNIVFPHEEPASVTDVFAEADSQSELVSPLAQDPQADSEDIFSAPDEFSEESEESEPSQVGGLSESDVDKESVFNEEQPIENPNKLIRKYSGTFAFAGGEVTGEDLADAEDLDISSDSYYNQDLIISNPTYNDNLIAIFRQTLEKLIALLKILMTRIL